VDPSVVYQMLVFVLMPVPGLVRVTVIGKVCDPGAGEIVGVVLVVTEQVDTPEALTAFAVLGLFPDSTMCEENGATFEI
jgi:hypothetical protein